MTSLKTLVAAAVAALLAAAPASGLGIPMQNYFSVIETYLGAARKAV